MTQKTEFWPGIIFQVKKWLLKCVSQPVAKKDFFSPVSSMESNATVETNQQKLLSGLGMANVTIDAQGIQIKYVVDLTRCLFIRQRNFILMVYAFSTILHHAKFLTDYHWPARKI